MNLRLEAHYWPTAGGGEMQRKGERGEEAGERRKGGGTQKGSHGCHEVDQVPPSTLWPNWSLVTRLIVSNQIINNKAANILKGTGTEWV